MFKRIIKIPGKSFCDLSLEEVASMIDADSSLRPHGNDLFDSCALDEFLHCADLEDREDLISLRAEILENIYIEIPGAKHKETNTDYLRQVAERLRSESTNAL